MRDFLCLRMVPRWLWWSVAAAVALWPAALAAAAESAAPSDPDVAAIRAAIDSYVSAYNRGDAPAVAAHWSETGVWTSPSGERFQGRAAIEKEMVALFAQNRQVRIEVLNPTVRIIAPDAAVEEGTVRVLLPQQPPDDSAYLAVHVKKNGQWKLDSVRETQLSPAAEGGAALQDLAWLVGQWGEQHSSASVEASVSWTRNEKFLNYSFKMTVPGQEPLEGTQVIGWDPAASTIRSWLFDSDGGFGEGVWSRQGTAWVVKFNQVLPDGRRAAATNIYTPLSANAFSWKSIGRTVEGESLPNIEATRVVRKGSVSAGPPAVPAVKAEAKK